MSTTADPIGLPSVSVVTPWRDHPELIADYEDAVRGADVVVVDNASAADNAALLRAMVDRLGGKYVRNDVNRVFAPANNQGLAETTGDVVVFLNSDVAAAPHFVTSVARDVQTDDLYGVSLEFRTILGVALPFIEGWCIAARRRVWTAIGGWDDAFTSPYWEDNEVCFRAMIAGHALRRMAWPVRHKVSQTSGGVYMWGEAYEENRAKLVARVRPHYERIRDELFRAQGRRG